MNTYQNNRTEFCTTLRSAWWVFGDISTFIDIFRPLACVCVRWINGHLIGQRKCICIHSIRHFEASNLVKSKFIWSTSQETNANSVSFRIDGVSTVMTRYPAISTEIKLECIFINRNTRMNRIISISCTESTRATKNEIRYAPWEQQGKTVTLITGRLPMHTVQWESVMKY